MSGSTLNDYANDYGEGIQDDVDLTGGDQIQIPEQPQPSKLEEILKGLKTPTGDGPVEEYMDKPLNFGKTPESKRAIARMLRGVTGFLGSLDFAVIDVVMGFLELNNTKGASHVNSIRGPGSPSGVNN